MRDDVAGLSQRIERRELSPAELVETLLDRIASLDPRLAAFMEVTAERARAAAREAEHEILAGRRRGPLHGIPFAVKDIIDVAGMRTTAGSRLLVDNVAKRDAPVVARLEAAGAILLGKTATYEFATGGPSFDLPWPPTRNPWNPDHGSGGSSTGSAAAVAAGLVPLALGTDTGGSIRVPASYCGITGFKPTFGRVSTDGVWPLAASFDTVGLLCRTAADAALAFPVITDADAVALSDDLRGLRIGFVRHLHEGLNSEVLAGLDEAIRVLRGLGASVTDVTLAPLEDYGAASRLITAAESFTVHRRALAADANRFGELFRYRVLPGVLVQGADYVAAQAWRERLTSQALAVLGSVDLLITASTQSPAPAFASMSYGRRLTPFLTIPFSLMRLPAISVCNGFTASGLPLGLQLGGRPGDDALVLRGAHAFQRATGWHERQPPAPPSSTARMPDWTPAELPEAAATERLIDACLETQGIRLTERQRRLLREGADTLLVQAAAARRAVGRDS
jgi:aspartyl-tRNA(Asn)/glutamyl-tRNA(Gln) amidotransferase subunit A